MLRRGSRVTLPPASRAAAAACVLLAGAVAGCGSAPSSPERLDGTYETTIRLAQTRAVDVPGEPPGPAGTWRLAIRGGRFAITRDSVRDCNWIYGALTRTGRRSMSWTVLDAGGSGAINEPDDTYELRWSRFRDVLTLSAVTSGSAGYFGVAPWRKVAATGARSRLGTRCPPPPAALEPTGAETIEPNPRAHLDALVRLVRSGASQWEGEARSQQLGRGRMTIAGHVVFVAPATRGRLEFAVRFPTGELGGCLIVEITRRPHARWLWDATSGQITSASAGLRRYRAAPVAIYGVTNAADLGRMDGRLDATPSRPVAGFAPRDLC
jgi:hypothetical protein